MLYERAQGRYEALRQEAVWNGIVPDRCPEAIARPIDRNDVAELVRHSRRTGWRVSVKSGGHNWRGACLRDSGLLIDMGGLQRVEVDPGERVALVEPGATHKVLADAIVPHRLGFPIGHCPTVGLGGYLLSGGYGWNPRIWGPACWSVRGLDVVTPRGDELFIDRLNHPDLFWAARGSGGGFPAIVTRFHLDLHPLPEIRSLRAMYPVERLAELLAWSERHRYMPPGIEISIIAMRSQNDRARAVAIIQATAFSSSVASAGELLMLVRHQLPHNGEKITAVWTYPTSLNEIEVEGVWVRKRRYAPDMCWVADGYEAVGERLAPMFQKAPSQLSKIVFAWVFPPDGGPDVAQTCNGTLSVNVYAIWGEEEAAGDLGNMEWTRSVMAALKPWTTGYYVGESDLSVSPDRVRNGYPIEKWERLQAVRARYDLDGAKFGYISEP